MKTYQVIFLIWAIVFAMWLVRQFAEHNKRKDKR